MKKSNKKSVRSSMRSYMDPPDVVNMDDLAYIADDELEGRVAYLFSERDRAVSMDVDVRPWEEEICYVQREMRIRLSRRAAHDRYMRSNPDSYTVWSTSEEEQVTEVN